MKLEERIDFYLDEEHIIALPTQQIYQEISKVWGTGKGNEVEELLKEMYQQQFTSHDFYTLLARRCKGIALYDLLAGRARKGIAWDIKQAVREFEPHHKVVIDVGCGTGIMGCFLAKENPECQLTLLDSSSAMLEIASQRAKKYDLQNVSLVHASLETYASSAIEFDFVICAHVLYEGALAGWEEAIAMERSVLLERLQARNGKTLLIENEAPIVGGHAEESEQENKSYAFIEKAYRYNDADNVGMSSILKVFSA